MPDFPVRIVTVLFQRRDAFFVMKAEVFHNHIQTYLVYRNGMPDFADADGDIAKKTYITALPGGESYTSTHTMTFTEGN